MALARMSVLAVGALLPAGLAYAQAPPVGTRIVHYAGSASIPGSRQQLVPHPNGGFMIRGTGQRVNIESTRGAGGHGYTIVDIVYSDGQTCVGTLTSVGMDPISGAISTLGYSGFATRGTCSDFWQPPQHLASLTPQQGDVAIARGQLEFSGMTLDTVGIATVSRDASSHSVYDLATGLLLFADTATSGADVLTPGPGGRVETGSGSTFLTHSRLEMARPLPLPTVPPDLPAHVQDLNALQYDCYSSMTFMGTSVTLGCAQEVRVVARGPGWLSLSVVQSTEDPITMIPSVGEYAFALAAGQLFGYYLAPSMADALVPGSVIDEDPVTGGRSRVVRADAQVVVLEHSLPTESITYVYDRASGWLVEVVRTQRLGGGVTETGLRLADVR